MSNTARRIAELLAKQSNPEAFLASYASFFGPSVERDLLAPYCSPRVEEFLNDPVTYRANFHPHTSPEIH